MLPNAEFGTWYIVLFFKCVAMASLLFYVLTLFNDWWEHPCAFIPFGDIKTIKGQCRQQLFNCISIRFEYLNRMCVFFSIPI